MNWLPLETDSFSSLLWSSGENIIKFNGLIYKGTKKLCLLVHSNAVIVRMDYDDGKYKYNRFLVDDFSWLAEGNFYS